MSFVAGEVVDDQINAAPFQGNWLIHWGLVWRGWNLIGHRIIDLRLAHGSQLSFPRRQDNRLIFAQEV